MYIFVLGLWVFLTVCCARPTKGVVRPDAWTILPRVLRLLVLKHLRNGSYEVLEREVRANLVYRDFTRVGGDKVPDAKTMGRWGMALGPAPIGQIHDRI